MFRCLLVEEDGRRTIREIAARDHDHAHLLALIAGTTPVSIARCAPSLVQRAWAWATVDAPEKFIVDVAAVIRSGRSAHEAVERLAEHDDTSKSGEKFRAIRTRLAAGQGLSSSIQSEVALPRWVEAALEIRPKRSDERHLEVIAASIDLLSERARLANAGVPETVALVAATLVILAARGSFGALSSVLMIVALILVLTPSGAIGRSITALRTARFLAILSTLIELGAGPVRAVDLAAEEIGDAPVVKSLRAAAAVAPETTPINRLLAASIDLPAVAGLMLSGDSLPAGAAAFASEELQKRAVRELHRLLATLRILAIIALGAVVLAALGR